MSKEPKLNRRTLLKGASAVVSLPMLEAMRSGTGNSQIGAGLGMVPVRVLHSAASRTLAMKLLVLVQSSLGLAS